MLERGDLDASLLYLSEPNLVDRARQQDAAADDDDEIGADLARDDVRIVPVLHPARLIEGDRVPAGQTRDRFLVPLSLVLVLTQADDAGDVCPDFDECRQRLVAPFGAADEQGSHGRRPSKVLAKSTGLPARHALEAAETAEPRRAVVSFGDDAADDAGSFDRTVTADPVRRRVRVRRAPRSSRSRGNAGG